MSPKSSVPQAASFVSQVLMSDRTNLVPPGHAAIDALGVTPLDSICPATRTSRCRLACGHNGAILARLGLCADVDAHLRRLEQGLSNLRLLVRATSHDNAAWNHDALLFTIDAMDQPIEAIGDLMESAGERSGSRRCSDRGSVSKAVAAATAPAANPELVALVHKLNDAISRSNLNKPKMATAMAAGNEKRMVQLNGIDEAIGAERSEIEQAILEFPTGSIGDLVILAKLAEHQNYYGQMSDDTPIALADRILRMFAGRPFIEPGEGRCADRPIII